jgi:hypothetical protein
LKARLFKKKGQFGKKKGKDIRFPGTDAIKLFFEK